LQIHFVLIFDVVICHLCRWIKIISNLKLHQQKTKTRLRDPTCICFNLYYIYVLLTEFERIFSCTKIYDKRDDFNFKIINFPNMCSNKSASPAYGVYISQLIRYARASSNYTDFLKHHLHLRNRLLDQGYKKIRLIRSLKKFIFRYQDLVEIYSISAEKIISDGFSYSENV
jgi:hypothetical protein